MNWNDHKPNGMLKTFDFKKKKKKTHQNRPDLQVAAPEIFLLLLIHIS